MITFESAKEIARRHIASLKAAPGVELVVLEDKIIQRQFGWVFFYNSTKYLETHDFRYSVLGSPFMIDRRDGSLHQLKSAPPVDFYIEKYEREHPFKDKATTPPSAPLARAPSRSAAAVSAPPALPAQPYAGARFAKQATRHEPRRLVMPLTATAVAALAIGFIATFGWLHYRHITANSVPVLAQYTPQDPLSSIQAVSLSSSMSPDFDTARVGTKFDKGITSAVLWYRWASAAPGEILEISWIKDGEEVLHQRLETPTSSGEQAYALRTPNGSSLPEGSYQVTLIEAGKPVTSIPFQIGVGK